jgi:hypothetical protein
MTDRINVVQIQTALLIPVTASFIVDKLGIKPCATEKRAVYWKPEDFTHICQGLISHITSVRNADFDKISGARPKKAEPAATTDAGGDFFNEEATDTETAADAGGDFFNEDATEDFF